MEIDFSLFSPKAQAIAQQSYEVALRYSHNHITREHILLACLGVANEEIISLLDKLNANVLGAKKRLELLVSYRLSTVPMKEIKLNKMTTSIQVKRFIEHSRIEADRLGEKIISSEILFLALIQSYFSGPDADRTLQEILTSFGITPEVIRKALLTKSFSESSFE
jgi:ATP-dependent Clp protease ATP-binding subunit ClpA